jgi:hypothetical protein
LSFGCYKILGKSYEIKSLPTAQPQRAGFNPLCQDACRSYPLRPGWGTGHDPDVFAVNMLANAASGAVEVSSPCSGEYMNFKWILFLLYL